MTSVAGTAQYVYSLPVSISFMGKGLLGYTFGPLKQRDVDIYYVEVNGGHDTFMVSRRIARDYYILSGGGYFTIAGCRYEVGPGMLVEVPPKVEYSYSGRMKLLIFAKPGWFPGNDRHTKWNPDVFSEGWVEPLPNASWWSKALRWENFAKRACLRLNRKLWINLPTSVAHSLVLRRYGDFVHKVAKACGDRRQAHSTFFLRNRPALELIRRLAQGKAKGATLRVAVLGCSTGPEAYSVAWRIRTARTDLNLVLQAADISEEAVEIARCGVYPAKAAALTGTNILERLTDAEIGEIFERSGDEVRVKTWVREGIRWLVGDVGGAEIRELLGPQDIVIASNFLCHMNEPSAEACLRNIARLVAPQGYLIVCGVDLDVRTKVSDDLGWSPVQELLEEIHDGDPCIRGFWPWQYGGLEPLDKRRRDWRRRYAAAFQVCRTVGEGKEPLR